MRVVHKNNKVHHLQCLKNCASVSQHTHEEDREQSDVNPKEWVRGRSCGGRSATGHHPGGFAVFPDLKTERKTTSK